MIARGKASTEVQSDRVDPSVYATAKVVVSSQLAGGDYFDVALECNGDHDLTITFVRHEETSLGSTLGRLVFAGEENLTIGLATLREALESVPSLRRFVGDNSATLTEQSLGMPR